MEKECRICFEKSKEPLINPCKCSGSMEWVHKSCLDKWLHFKKSNICPVCKSEFVFNTLSQPPIAKVASFIVKSDMITTISTIITCLMITYFCLRYDIRPNTIAICFFGLTKKFVPLVNIFGLKTFIPMSLHSFMIELIFSVFP